jgi:hypothetical protein
VRPALVVISVLALAFASCTRIPTPEDANNAVLSLRGWGSWAWALGVGLISADLVLPIPQTAVIAALGIIYGTLLGGLLGSLGLITSGVVGYLLMLTSARRFVQRVVGRQSRRKMESLFERGGVWAIVVTRSRPATVTAPARGHVDAAGTWHSRPRGANSSRHYPNGARHAHPRPTALRLSRRRRAEARLCWLAPASRRERAPNARE